MIERVGKWLNADERRSESGKTSIFRLTPTDGTRAVGFIGWYGKWRKYALQPEPETVFEEDCLRAIADFCALKTREHRDRLKQRRDSSKLSEALSGTLPVDWNDPRH